MKKRLLCTVLIAVLFFISSPFASYATATAQNMSISMNEDGGLRSVTLQGRTNIRNESLTFYIVDAPTLGSVSLSGRIASYAPNANANGTDRFTYQAYGATSGYSNVATVTVTINARNDAPVATSGITATTTENTAVIIQLNGTDVDGDTLTYYSTGAGSSGATWTVDQTTGRASYTPPTNFTGTAQPGFRVYDGTTYSQSSTVTITVTETNVAPTANNVSATTAEDNSVMITLSAQDNDGDTLKLSLASQPTHGTTSWFDTKTVIYSPEANWNGTDSLNYIASDGQATSNTATVDVTVSSENDAPEAIDATIQTTNQSTVEIHLSGTDIDGDALNYRLVTQPDNGWVSEVTDGNAVNFTPNAAFTGVTSFTFSVNDGARSDNGTVTVNVDAAPSGYPVAVTTLQNEAVEITPEANDLDSDALTFTIVSAPNHGTVTQTSDEVFRYVPETNFFGQDSWTLTASDGLYGSAPFTVTVSVVPDSGVAGASIPQIGINFPLFSPTSALTPDYLYSIMRPRYQSMRQLGGADTNWGTIEPEDDVDMTAFGEEVRSQADENGLVIFNSMFAIMFGSCTQPGIDFEASPELFEHFMTPYCEDYIARAARTMNAVHEDMPTRLTWYEPGNELFHFEPRYGELLNYTNEEMAAVIDQTVPMMKANIENSITVMPSTMLTADAAVEWKADVEAAIGTDWYDVENIHDYEEWGRFPANIKSYKENSHVNGKLMMMTETCRSSEPDDTRTTGNTLEAQAAHAFQLPTMAFGDSFFSVSWHSLIHGTTAEDELDGCGVINPDGSLLPVAYTQELFKTEMIPFKQVINLSGDGLTTMAYQYTLKTGEEKYVVWGSDAWTVPQGVSQMTSVMPNANGVFEWVAVQPGQTIQLVDTPYLLE